VILMAAAGAMYDKTPRGQALSGDAAALQRRQEAFRFRLVPNAHEQAALARGKALRKSKKSYRYIAQVWATEFGLPKFDAKSIQRMLPTSPRSASRP
jgi:hypothetical protein